MRILGVLRDWFKLAFLLIPFLMTSRLYAVDVISSHKQVLEKAFAQSAEYKSILAQLEVDTIDAQSLVALYNWNLSGGFSRLDAERPITNPFAPNGQATTNYNLRLEKESLSGISPFLELNSDEANLSFPNGNSSNFQTATIEAGLRVDVMKAIFLKKSLKAFSESKTRKELAEVSKAAAKQAFATRISQAYFKVLSSHKALEILNTQCSEYLRLQKTSSKRFKKRLIQEKDFLTIEVLYQNCLLDQKTAENNRAMDELSLLKTAGLSLETQLDLSKAEFPVQSLQSAQVDVANNLDFKLAKKIFKASSQKALSLRSDLLPEVDFSYSLGSTAAGTSVGNALGEAIGFDQLTHSVGLNLKYEFGDSSSKLSAKRALAFESLKKYELDELQSSLDRDAKTLTKNIFYLNSALSRARALVKLQERKSKLFNRDFSNGRGSIRDLVEAQVAYLSSLEKVLRFQYNLSGSYVDLKQIKGESVAEFN